MIYHSDKGYLALRKGDWVLLDCKGSGGWSLPEEDADPTVDMQLYDLKKDPAERINLAAKYPERVKAMKKELEELKNKPW